MTKISLSTFPNQINIIFVYDKYQGLLRKEKKKKILPAVDSVSLTFVFNWLG